MFQRCLLAQDLLPHCSCPEDGHKKGVQTARNTHLAQRGDITYQTRPVLAATRHECKKSPINVSRKAYLLSYRLQTVLWAAKPRRELTSYESP
jgi:hypothetical protein